MSTPSIPHHQTYSPENVLTLDPAELARRLAVTHVLAADPRAAGLLAEGIDSYRARLVVALHMHGVSDADIAAMLEQGRAVQDPALRDRVRRAVAAGAREGWIQ